MPWGLKFSLPHRMCRNCGLAHFSVIPASLAYVFLYCRGWILSCGSASGCDLKEEKKVKLLSHVRLSATPWAVACQAPLSMEFSGQEYWSGSPFPSPGDFPKPRIELGLLHCRHILYHLSSHFLQLVLYWDSHFMGLSEGKILRYFLHSYKQIVFIIS